MASGVATSSKSIFGFDPRTVPGCQLWLDAADRNTLFSDAAGTTLATSTVGSWRDKSNNGILAISSGSPTTTTVNGHTSISFNGSSQYFQKTTFTLTNSATYVAWFAVANVTNYAGVTNACIVGTNYVSNNYCQNTLYVNSGVGVIFYRNANAGTNKTLSSGAVTTNTVFQTETDYITGQYQINLNGSGLVSTTGGLTGAIDNGTVNLQVGWDSYSGDSYVAGTISECLLFTSPVSPANKRAIEGYLAWKWGLQSSLLSPHPYSQLIPYSRFFQPTDILGCQLWLDAADTSSLSLTGSVVNTWKDKSGNAYSGTSSGSPTLVTNSQNGLPCINFSAASSQYFNFGNIINLGSSGISIFIVGKTTFVGGTTQSFIAKSKFAGAAGRWGFIYYNSLLDFALDKDGVSSADTTYSATTYSGVFSLFECTWNLSNSITYAFGTQTATSSSPFSTSLSNTFPLYVGVYQDGGGATPLAGTYYNGTIGEILVYNSALTTGQRQQVEGYLAKKWGLQSSLGGTTTTTTFSYTGATQTFTVPLGVTSIQLSMTGGGGGGGGGLSGYVAGPGGAGGLVSGSYTVTQGTTYTLYVAGGGLGVVQNSSATLAGGFGGGGSANEIANNNMGGSGGGASYILLGSTLIAAVGGGGGGGGVGSGVGAIGGGLTAAPASGAFGGAGASQSSGGVNTNNSLNNGSYLQGGTGNLAGGGGGGYYGGAGSAGSGGGGGGSSYVALLTGTVVNTSGGGASGGTATPGTTGGSGGNGGNGSITITFPTHPFTKIPPTSPSLFSPTSINGCAIWIDGNDPYGTGVVPASGATFATTSATIKDKSGNGYHLTPTATINYSTQFLNNMGVLNFGTACAQNSSFNWTTNFTQFVVVKCAAGTWGTSYINPTGSIYWSYAIAANSTTNLVYIIRVGTSYAVYDATVTNQSIFTNTGNGLTAWTIFCIGYTAGSTSAVNYTLNGKVYTSGTATSFNGSQATNLTLTLNGNLVGSYDTSYVAEFIHYNASLSTNQRQQVEGYLAGKWGLQGLLPTTHPYYKNIPAAVSSYYFYESFENALVTSGAYPFGVYIVWNEWASSAGSSVGISWVGSTWDAPGSVINGTHYAYAQASGSLISRVFQGPVGYTASLSFSISYRSAYSANPFSDGNYSVIVNWTPTGGSQVSLGTFTVVSTGWATYSTAFTFTASSGTLTFLNNCNSAAQQVTAAVAAGRTPNQSNYGANVSVAQTISSIAPSTPSTGFVTYTTSATHAITAGQVVLISGLTTTAYNGSYYVIAVTTNTFRVSNTTTGGTTTGQSGTIATIPGIGDNSINLDNILIT